MLVETTQARVAVAIRRADRFELTERGALAFDGVRVPRAYQLGAPGRGFAQAMEAFDYNRAIIALACIGTAQQSLDETVEYARTRSAFGERPAL